MHDYLCIYVFMLVSIYGCKHVYIHVGMYAGGHT